MDMQKEMQSKMLSALKPLLRPNQQKLIDITIALAEGEDKWIKDDSEADKLLKRIKTMIG